MALYDLYDDEDDKDDRYAFGALAGAHEPVEASNAMSASDSAAYANLDDKLGDSRNLPAEAIPAKPLGIAAPEAREAVQGPDAGGQEQHDMRSAYYGALANEGHSLDTAHAEADAEQDSFGKHISGWALVADLLMNKGKGVGSILAQANDQAGRARTERRSTAERAEGRKIQGGYLQLAKDKAAQAVISDAEQSERLKRHDEADLAVKTNAITDSRLDNERQLMALDDAKTHQTNADAEAERYHRETLDDRKQAHEDSHADRMLRAGQLTEATQDRLDRKAAADDERAATRLREDNTRFSNTFSAKTKFARDAALQLQEIDSVFAKDAYKDGKDLPGIGQLDSADGATGWVRGLVGKVRDNDFDKDSRTVRGSLENLANAVLRSDTGAGAHMSEEQKTQIRTGARAGATEAEAREAMRLIKRTVHGDLNSFATGNEDIAREVLTNAGINTDFMPAKKTAAPASPSPSPSSDDTFTPKPVRGPVKALIDLGEDDQEKLRGLGLRPAGRR